MCFCTHSASGWASHIRVINSPVGPGATVLGSRDPDSSKSGPRYLLPLPKVLFILGSPVFSLRPSFFPRTWPLDDLTLHQASHHREALQLAGLNGTTTVQDSTHMDDTHDIRKDACLCLAHSGPQLSGCLSHTLTPSSRPSPIRAPSLFITPFPHTTCARALISPLFSQ